MRSLDHQTNYIRGKCKFFMSKTRNILRVSSELKLSLFLSSLLPIRRMNLIGFRTNEREPSADYVGSTMLKIAKYCWSISIECHHTRTMAVSTEQARIEYPNAIVYEAVDNSHIAASAAIMFMFNHVLYCYYHHYCGLWWDSALMWVQHPSFILHMLDAHGVVDAVIPFKLLISMQFKCTVISFTTSNYYYVIKYDGTHTPDTREQLNRCDDGDNEKFIILEVNQSRWRGKVVVFCQHFFRRQPIDSNFPHSSGFMCLLRGWFVVYVYSLAHLEYDVFICIIPTYQWMWFDIE